MRKIATVLMAMAAISPAALSPVSGDDDASSAKQMNPQKTA